MAHVIFWIYLADLRQLYPCVVVLRSTMDDEQWWVRQRYITSASEASGAGRGKGR